MRRNCPPEEKEEGEEVGQPGGAPYCDEGAGRELEEEEEAENASPDGLSITTAEVVATRTTTTTTTATTIG
ncbi:hypothetical protein E2C01_000653 [Portunus trituberculatus]|uniref:Uncharacterized protein n=1 Tax=Portunus trituberculatus TaxID=210409 RepID=A0A5B7CFN2_PORTR|nr:hypothetical protein [Portunus trituberculatus]